MKLRWIFVIVFLALDWVVLAAVMLNSGRISRQERRKDGEPNEDI